jgi:hypothetical protein
MFTGIVEELGTVRSSHAHTSEWGAGVRLVVEADVVLRGSVLGASIAVNGCCLTLVDQGPGWWATDVSDETLSRTNIGALAAGDRVNLERPMALGDRLGGHIVLGHVDCVGTILSPAPDLVVRIPASTMRCRRHQSHRLRSRRRPRHGHVPRGRHPAHRRGHHARREGAGEHRQHRDRRPGQAHRASGHAVPRRMIR